MSHGEAQMREALGSEHAAKLVGDVTVVVAATLWSVLLFCVVAALAAGAVNAIRGGHTSIRSVVGKVALIALLVAGPINVSTDLLHRPKGSPDQALSMAEFGSILISPLLLLTWGLAAMVQRGRRAKRGGRREGFRRRSP